MPFRELRECTELIDDFATWGLTHSDITGGEPTLHPDICEIVRYMEDERDIRGRLITLGQFTMRTNKRTGNLLVDDLLRSGLSDFLFSIHAASEELFKSQTKGSLAQVKKTMEYLDAVGMSYTSNTVVQEYNFEELPALAKYLSGR
jgi:molybdenum cofactor biosynthesis enzyme MoaA